MNELKPCPFCGKEPLESSDGLLICEGHTKWGSRFEWNSRPIENELEAEIVRLEKRIKELEEKLAYEQEIWHNIYSGEAKGL